MNLNIAVLLVKLGSSDIAHTSRDGVEFKNASPYLRQMLDLLSKRMKKGNRSELNF